MDNFERPKTIVQWMLGNNCNYNCSYCLDIFKRGDFPTIDSDHLLEVSKEIIYHYDDLGRDVVFEFVGGEPTLMEKIPEIGNRLHNYPTNIVLKTNGSASIEWWKSTRRYLSEVIITVHKEFANIEHIRELIYLFNDDTNYHPVKLQILFPVTNKDESWNWGVSKLKEFNSKYELGELQLLYSDFGRGSTSYLPYTKKQREEYFDITGIDIRESSEETISVEPTETNITINTKADPFSFRGWNCNAGIDILTIDGLGNVFRGWCMQGGNLGNIYNRPVNWPSESIVCNKDICNNGFDRLASKNQL